MITIDTREQPNRVMKGEKSSIMDFFEQFDIGINIKIEKLCYGDYLLQNGRNTICIERKRYSDICNKKNLGVMLKRNEKAREVYKHFYLLLEEDNRPHVERGNMIYIWSGKELRPMIPRSTLYKVLDLELWRGTPCIYSSGLEGSVRRIVSMYHNMQNVDFCIYKHQMSAVSLLRNFPGVGDKKLEKLLQTYDGSVFKVLENVEDWATDKQLEWLDQNP